MTVYRRSLDNLQLNNYIDTIYIYPGIRDYTLVVTYVHSAHSIMGNPDKDAFTIKIHSKNIYNIEKIFNSTKDLIDNKISVIPVLKEFTMLIRFSDYTITSHGVEGDYYIEEDHPVYTYNVEGHKGEAWDAWFLDYLWGWWEPIHE